MTEVTSNFPCANGFRIWNSDGVYTVTGADGVTVYHSGLAVHEVSQVLGGSPGTWSGNLVAHPPG